MKKNYPTAPILMYTIYVDTGGFGGYLKQHEEITAFHRLIHDRYESGAWGERFPLFMHKFYFYKLEIGDMYGLSKEMQALDQAIIQDQAYLDARVWSAEKKAFVKKRNEQVSAPDYLDTAAGFTWTVGMRETALKKVYHNCPHVLTLS